MFSEPKFIGRSVILAEDGFFLHIDGKPAGFRPYGNDPGEEVSRALSGTTQLGVTVMPVTETRYSEEDLKTVLAAYELAMHGRRLTGLRFVVTPATTVDDRPTGGYGIVAVVESDPQGSVLAPGGTSYAHPGTERPTAPQG